MSTGFTSILNIPQKYRIKTSWNNKAKQYEDIGSDESLYGGKIRKFEQMRILALGCGVHSTAALIKFHKYYNAAVYSETGSEHKETYEYIENILKPLAKKYKVPFVTVSAKNTVFNAAVEHKMPVHFFQQRQCTIRHKILPMFRWIRQQKPQPNKNNPCIVDLGITVDEYARRAGSDYEQLYATKNYPLVDFNITADDCKKIILAENIPIPHKSACEFCPFAGLQNMREYAQRKPDKFKLLVDAEKSDPKYPQYLIFRGRKLENLLTVSKLDNSIEEDSRCDSGHCDFSGSM